ncbi:hypothetical protein F7725_002438 [Dissostichus mawsoni]|uniref:Uncharacterized protein n=1 Tax=Dissostichus mawsoni TaxID=36200 RepID=A0A7J5Y468_DISMA|nr:hypothetical protein F7725_002438 [Dissostichus mawsoni]
MGFIGKNPMGQWSTLGSLLFFLGLSGICTGFEQENCTDYRLQFERVYSVPGEVAMLNSTLASYDVFNISAVPYNITWYDSKSHQEISNETGRTVVRGETLWFLNTRLDNDGEYVSVLRTPSGCYRQNTRLIVELPVPGKCGRLRKAGQTINKGVSEYLSCPLKEYISKLNSYNTTYSLMWYKGCAPIVDGNDSYSYEDNAKLKIDKGQLSANCARTRSETVPVKGVWMERVLTISKLQEKDYNINYTCRASSARGKSQSYFTLLPTDSDGKLYDAYVAYSQPNTEGFSNEVEAFVLHTLPEVLEKACGYKLFIAGRDCMPGMAIVDSVEENIQASRRLLLLYTASTFMRKRLTSSISSKFNNKITKSSDSRDSTENSESKKENDRSSNMSFDGGEENIQTQDSSWSVILVELEEITPAQLALFPESVRHLRKKQGAVCWWKNQSRAGRWRTCMSTKEDEEKGGQLSQSLSPSSRFWKEMRYHMPVKGKRAMCPEKATLLNRKGKVVLQKAKEAMGQRSTLGSLLFFLGLSGICTGFEQAVPYNITWYDSKMRQEISNETGRTVVRGETLWFLNTRLDNDGEYVSVLRTPSGCYRQNTRLIVELPVPGKCGRPRKAGQTITKGVTDYLSCPLKEYISKLNSYNTTYSLMWYKGCAPIVDGNDSYSYEDNAKLKIDKVETKNQQSYTCTLTFTLDGTIGSVSESIEAWVNEKYSLTPQVRQPAGGIIKAPIDSDGKLYDAYVAYSQPNTEGFSNEVEAFVLHTLPEVLEKACGYKLFIAGRDCMPGMAIVDSVEENIQASRRLLLLYTASTFMRKRLTSSISSNNNNITKSSDSRDSTENSESKKENDRSSNMSFDGGDSGGAGRDHPCSAGSLPRVGASPEEEAGCRVLVEEPEQGGKMEDMYEDERGRGERWTVIAIPLPFLQVLEGDEIPYAGKGQEGDVPRESDPVEHKNTNVTWSRGGGHNLSLPSGVEVIDGGETGVTIGLSVSSEKCPEVPETKVISAGVNDGIEGVIAAEPKVNYPQKEVVVVKEGTTAEVKCEAFIGFSDESDTYMYWTVDNISTDDFTQLSDSSHFVQDGGRVYGLSTLSISEVHRQFIDVPISCCVQTALEPDHSALYPSVSLCISASLAVAAFLFFKVDLVLAYRKLLRHFSKQQNVTANFALQILPKEMEKHGYSLFIRGRDDCPGEAVHDVIAAMVRRCHRLIIILSPEIRSSTEGETEEVEPLCDNQTQLCYEQKIGVHDALTRNEPRVWDRQGQNQEIRQIDNNNQTGSRQELEIRI